MIEDVVQDLEIAFGDGVTVGRVDRRQMGSPQWRIR